MSDIFRTPAMLLTRGIWVSLFFSGFGTSAYSQVIHSTPDMEAYFSADAVIEVLDSGFQWSEGPVWSTHLNALLFSDVPANTIHIWSELEGSRVYLSPSGYTGDLERGGEMGSNGLLINADGALVLCQHGNRTIAAMNAPLSNPRPAYFYLATTWNQLKFNSPNDIIQDRSGRYYFTDPPYGLEKNMEDAAKEIGFQGVYRLDTAGNVQLLTSELSRPNGLAFSTDQSRLYVANSDFDRALWMEYPVTAQGIGPGRIFVDATDSVGSGNPGLPDGMKVHSSGTLFATGPGGIWVILPDATVAGLIRTGVPTSNCAFNADESALYITADDYLMRVKLKKQR